MKETYSQPIFKPYHPAHQSKHFTYGKSNKIRKQQPNMFQMLSWPLSLTLTEPTDQKQEQVKKQQKQKASKQIPKVTQNKKYNDKNEDNNEKTKQSRGLQSHHQKSFKVQYNTKQVKKQQPKQQRDIEINNQETNSLEKSKKRMQKFLKFKQATRQISNTSFTTYFGKPPFENYGYANINPLTGGIIYGTYLFSHSVYPHCGTNSPQSLQCYPQALKIAEKKGPIIPVPPRKKFDEQYESNNDKEKSQSLSIYPIKNSIGKLKIEKPFDNNGQVRHQQQKSINNLKNQKQKIFTNRLKSPSLKKVSKYQKSKNKKGKKVQKDKNNYNDWVVLKEQSKNDTGISFHNASNSQKAFANPEKIYGKKICYNN